MFVINLKRVRKAIQPLFISQVQILPLRWPNIEWIQNCPELTEKYKNCTTSYSLHPKIPRFLYEIDKSIIHNSLSHWVLEKNHLDDLILVRSSD